MLQRNIDDDDFVFFIGPRVTVNDSLHHLPALSSNPLLHKRLYNSKQNIATVKYIFRFYVVIYVGD